MAADGASGPHASSAGLAKHPTESHWHSEAGWVPEPQPVPAAAQAVVIGGGLCGGGTAYWLNQRGHDCVLIEGRTLAGGASGRNGGVISPTHATPQSRAFHEENIAHLAKVLEEQGIDCEYRVGGYLSLAYEDTAEAGRVGKQAEDDTTEYWDAEKVQSELGGAETFVVDGAPRKIAGGMFKRDSGHVWPAKLVQTLAKSCTRTRFCTHTVALSLAAAGPDNSEVVVQTDKGTVIAERVCVCTNGWAPRLLPQLGRTGALHPVRNNVVMTAPYKKTWAWPEGPAARMAKIVSFSVSIMAWDLPSAKAFCMSITRSAYDWCGGVAALHATAAHAATKASMLPVAWVSHLTNKGRSTTRRRPTQAVSERISADNRY